jgi:septum formation protein
MNLILGSASKSRKRVLERQDWDFQVMTADINEKAIRFDDAKQLTLALAWAKAEEILKKIHQPSILITADQVVVCNGVIREKPVDEKQAREFLESYAIYPAEAVNGICVVSTATDERRLVSDTSKIKFKPIPREVIDKLIEEKNIFAQAGAFSAEDPLLSPFIDYIEGSLDSIEGLPMDLIKKLIAELGGIN